MKRVLLVEDSRTQARHVQSVLQAAGCAVVVRHDGAAGLEAAVEHPPDVVLSDVLMPELDGFELCLALRRDPRTCAVPIVVMTSLTDSEDVLRALACGADGYVSKPVRDDVLVARVRRMLAPARTSPATVRVHGRELPIHAPREKILDVLTCALEDAAARHDELATSRAHLEDAKAQQDELMGIVAHELRTPLNVLSLRAAIETGERAEGHASRSLPPLAELVDRNVRGMTLIIDDLLDVARIESGAIRVQPRAGDLSELVREVGERFAMVSARHPIEIEAPAHQLAIFDAARVEQIMANLLSNAIKYSPDGGRVRVRVQGGEDVVRVEVEDRGIGLPEDFEEQLFRRYARAPGGERVAKGVGLGLYITRRLLEMQGGEIRAENVEPQGARFTFTLPASAARPTD